MDLVAYSFVLLRPFGKQEDETLRGFAIYRVRLEETRSLAA
jgi:hypothetical protein